MNTVVIKRGIGQIAANMTIAKPLAGAVLVGLLISDITREAILRSLADAYFQVSVFVAATLLGTILFERIRRRRICDILRDNPKWQIVIAATLGAIPGCGGAIVVMTQYIRGALSFGGVVAVLTATMGDAAFLLLAKAPREALVIFVLCYVVGIVFGYAVDWFHGRDFMRARVDDYEAEEEDIEENPLLEPVYKLWMLLFVPGAVCALAIALQVDVAAQWSIGGADWVTPFGVAAALLAMVMWLLNPLSDIIPAAVEWRIRFITFWVLCGFVGYTLSICARCRFAGDRQARPARISTNAYPYSGQCAGRFADAPRTTRWRYPKHRPISSVFLFSVIDGVFGNLHGQIAIANNALARQTRFRLQTPCLIQKVFFILVRFVQRIKTIAHNNMASCASAGFFASMLYVYIVGKQRIANRNARCRFYGRAAGT